MTTKGKILTGFGLFNLIFVCILGGSFIIKQSKLKDIDARQHEAEELAGELTQLRGEYKAMKALEKALNLNALRFSVLSTLKAVAENITDGATLDSISFTESHNPQVKVNNVVLRGQVSQGDTGKLQEYSDALAETKLMQDDSKPLFREVMPPNLDHRAGGYLSWYIVCATGKKEAQEKSSDKKRSVSISTSPIKYQRKDSTEFLADIPREELELKIASYKKERELLQAKLAEMAPLKAQWKKQGYPIKEEDPKGQDAQKLMQVLESSARRSGINFTRSRGIQVAASKDSNFMEYKRAVSFQTGNKEFTGFLNTILRQSPVIRVSKLEAQPTTDRRKLRIDLTYTISFPRNMEALKLDPVTSDKNSTQTASLHKKIDQATQLFVKADPFRLIKPEPPKPEPKIVIPPRRIGVPQLSGILRINGRTKAILRVSSPRGGRAEYVQLAVGEALHGVEVRKIELGKGQVQVLINDQTFDLELDKPKRASSSTSSSRGSSSRGSSRPAPVGGGLKPVSGRNRSIQP